VTSCNQSHRIQDYLDGLLPAPVLRAFEVHLESCASCSAEVAAYRAVFASLHAVPLASPRETLADRVVARLRAEASAPRRCPESRRVQDHLDETLGAAERERFASHAIACVRCSADIAAYRDLFASLDALPLVSPSATLAERILARVLPSRVRLRWVRALGWGYAATFAVSLLAATVWVAQPGAQEALAGLSSEVSSRFTGSVVLALRSLALMAQGIAGGWGLLLSVGAWVAPLNRALSPLVANPTVVTALAAAGIACAALVAWMQARQGRAAEERNHVSIVGL
jgi:hypothetical protein